MNTENLTDGNIKYQLIGLTLPLILSNILQELYNTIDTYMAVSYTHLDKLCNRILLCGNKFK